MVNSLECPSLRVPVIVVDIAVYNKKLDSGLIVYRDNDRLVHGHSITCQRVINSLKGLQFWFPVIIADFAIEQEELELRGLVRGDCYRVVHREVYYLFHVV